MVLEDVVEEAERDFGVGQPEVLGLLLVAAVGARDRQLLGELGIFATFELETELDHALGERHAVFAFAARNGGEHGAHLGIGRGVAPRREVAMCVGLGVGDAAQQAEIRGLIGHYRSP
jgi:hypothetical protein